MTAAAAIVTRIDDAWRAFLETRTVVPAPHPYVYASSWRECLRRMVFDMTIPEQQPRFPADALARFRRGDDRERDLLADLAAIGRNATPPFRLVGQQQRFAVNDRKGRTVIAGKVDARVEVDGVQAPLEIKSWAAWTVDRIERFEDVFASPWTQAGGYQMLAYLYGAGVEFGFLCLDQTAGIPKLLEVELERHLDRMEEFLARAARAVDHVEAGTLPDYLENDPDECLRCPYFGSVCNPPLAANKTIEILLDPALEAALERHAAIQKIGKEFADLDDEIKTRLRGLSHAAIGHFELRGFWGKQSRVDLPPDLKAQYTTTNPRGRFTLQIINHGEKHADSGGMDQTGTGRARGTGDAPVEADGPRRRSAGTRRGTRKT
jgi:hypothetical protein